MKNFTLLTRALVVSAATILAIPVHAAVESTDPIKGGLQTPKTTSSPTASDVTINTQDPHAFGGCTRTYLSLL